MRGLEEAVANARSRGIHVPIQVSTRKGKRFMALFEGRVVHFGLWPYQGSGTWVDHKDESIRKAWRARHSKIMVDGRPAYTVRGSPSWFSWNYLW